MTGSTYTADKWNQVQAIAVSPSAAGISHSCPAGAITNIDLVLTDDVFFRGIQFISSGATLGDTITMQVIDTNGITGAAPGTILLTPVNNWSVTTDSQMTINYEAMVPKKALATFTLRVIYTSTGLLTPVAVAINYEFLKLLF